MTAKATEARSDETAQQAQPEGLGRGAEGIRQDGSAPDLPRLDPAALREAVARIIDPQNWQHRDDYIGCMAESVRLKQCAAEVVADAARRRVEVSLAKADAILSLTAQPERPSEAIPAEPWAWGWYELGGTKVVWPYLPTVDRLKDAETEAFPLYAAAPQPPSDARAHSPGGFRCHNCKEEYFGGRAAPERCHRCGCRDFSAFPSWPPPASDAREMAMEEAARIAERYDELCPRWGATKNQSVAEKAAADIATAIRRAATEPAAMQAQAHTEFAGDWEDQPKAYVRRNDGGFTLPRAATEPSNG